MVDSKIKSLSNPLKRYPRQQTTAIGKKTRTRRPSRPQPTPRKETWATSIRVRFFMVWGVLVLGSIGLAWNLYRLQILNAGDLEEKARQQQMVSLRPYIPRRNIIDRKNNVIATDRLVYSLYAHPKVFKKSKEEVAKEIAPILERTPESLVKEFNKRDTGIRLSYALAEDVADRLSKLSIDGIDLIRQYSRFYPQQELLGDVLGYVDQDHQGKAGIEYSQESLLERNIMTLRLSRAGNGSLMPTYLPEGLLNFDQLQLQLTLDIPLQRAVRYALKKQLAKFHAKRGAVIVMDVRDGSILALACEPTYDPNQYWKSDIKLFKNWAVADAYEPGSTFKPVNVAIALDAKAITPNTTVYDGGNISVGNWVISNHNKRGNGTISIAQILQVSSNIGMVKIMQRVDPKEYYKVLKKLGLGELIGIDMPGESPGQLKSESLFTSAAIEPATTAFGQGLSLTPLKLVQLHAAVANGGKLVTPHVVKGLVDPQGHFHWQPALKTTQVFTPQSSREVTEMMETVVLKGSGKGTIIPGYRIGGKTGTAQKASANGGYMSGAKITSFIANLPTNNPRYVILAVVDEPQGGNTFGATVALPIVKSVIEALIAIEGIPPSKN